VGGKAFFERAICGPGDIPKEKKGLVISGGGGGGEEGTRKLFFKGFSPTEKKEEY